MAFKMVLVTDDGVQVPITLKFLVLMICGVSLGGVVIIHTLQGGAFSWVEGVLIALTAILFFFAWSSLGIAFKSSSVQPKKIIE